MIRNISRSRFLPIRDENVLACIHKAEYLPIYILKDGMFNSYSVVTPLASDTSLRNVFYSKPGSSDNSGFQYGYRRISNYRQLKDILCGYHNSAVFSFRVGGEGEEVVATKGFLMSPEGDVLMSLSLRSTEDNINKYAIQSPLTLADSEDLVLLLSHDFTNSEKYKNLYRRLHKEYIVEVIEESIDILHTTSQRIEKLLFSNDLKIIPEDHNMFTQAISNLSINNIRLFLNNDYSYLNPDTSGWGSVQGTDDLENEQFEEVEIPVGAVDVSSPFDSLQGEELDEFIRNL